MWLLVGAATLGVFLATRDPLIAAALPYVFAAWPGVQSAIWLRLRDPVPARGKTCFWFYLSAAACQAAASAVVTYISLIVVEVWLLPNQVGWLPIAMARHVALAVVLVAGMLGTIGVASALINRVQVFVWPPLYFHCRGDMRRIATAPQHALVPAISALVLAWLIPIALLSLLQHLTLLNPARLPPAFRLSLALFVFGLLPVGSFGTLQWCISKVIVEWPEDCWPEYRGAGSAPEVK